MIMRLGANSCGINMVIKWAADLNQYACESLRLSHPGTNEIEPPEILVCSLRPYQKHALY
nr:DNA (cytosine-5)-methyltransferase CMT3-like [Ipomoea batatas]